MVDPNSVPLFPNGGRAKLSYAQFERLHAFSRASLRATCYPELFRILADFCRDIGAGAVNCAIFDNRRLELIGVSTSMKPVAVNRYFAENLTQDDPLIPRIRSNREPALLGWGLGVTPLWQTENSARMLPALQIDGYHGLLYFPVHVAGSSFSASITIRNELEPERGQAFLSSEYGLLQLAADMAGHRAAELFQVRAIDEHWHAFGPSILSPREQEIVQWIASGMRADQIAYQLDIKPVTVHMHLRSARHKLGAQTSAQMIARASLRGLL